MTVPPLVKICGIRSTADGVAAMRAGADWLGFVFVPKSPRAIGADAAGDIVTEIKQLSYDEGFEAPQFCGLFVNAGEKLLAEAAPFLTHFQFHGQEDAERIAEIRDEFGVQMIKAVGVGAAGDLDGLDALAAAADFLLFDAKPPKGALPGGNGAPFDWRLVERYRADTPFLLAGGLTCDTVGAAVAGVGSHPAFVGVDVSSGVESRPGEKDALLLAHFIKAAKSAR
jgi:phosphoribosylanthranilate isomerase